MKKTMKMDSYRTKDLSEASYLYASGKKLLKLDKIDGICWFIFNGRDSCEKLTDAFWRKEAVVNAKDYADSIRTLKDMIFNRRR